MVACSGCTSEDVVGNFCNVCGTPVKQVKPTGSVEVGAMVTHWNELRGDLEEARTTVEELEKGMDLIAGALREEHGITMPTQGEQGQEPTPKMNPPEEVSPEPERPQPTGKAKKILEGTRTGPSGGVDNSGSAAEVPVGPSDGAKRALREGGIPTQHSTGSIEDDHEGKIDSTVDEARADSAGGDDKGQQFQAAVAATFARTVPQ